MAKTGLTYDQLETAFTHQNFKPLYFFYGEERLLIDELQSLFLKKALEPHERDFNQDIVYGAEAEATSVLALCASYPVMAQRRVVVVRDFDKLKENQLFSTYAQNPNPHAVVLLVCGDRPNLTMKPYRALKDKAASAEFKPLYERQIPGWIKKRIEASGYQIEPSAVQMLAEYVGTNLQSIATEIEKLITYVGHKEKITDSDVVQASGQIRGFSVFELQRAVGEGRYSDSMRITERMLQKASNTRSESLMIVAVLTGYFNKLWKLTVCQAKRMSEKAMAQRIGVPFFFIKQYLSSLNVFNITAIERAFEVLLAADYELKGGSSRDSRLVLTLMLRRLIPLTTNNN